MTRFRLWMGPIAVLLFAGGCFAIGLITPGYSHVRQTLSELGEVGAPGRVPFTILLCVIGVSLLTCASSIAHRLRELGDSALPAYFVGAMAISCAGVGIFAFPHPLHNVFGLSETVGLQAPLIAALTSRWDARLKRVRAFSIAMYVLIVLAIAINVLALVRPAELWAHIKPFFGLIQRFLFAPWFIWCAGYAIFLSRAGLRPLPNDL